MTTAGVREMEHDQYLSHNALSASGAKLLLPPSCPALFKYHQENPPPTKAVYEFGHAAHHKVLGTGHEIVVVDAENWMKKADQQARKDIRAAGKIPLLPAELAVVDEMAAAIKAHPLAGRLFNPDNGKAEQSLFWTDEESGVERRGRLDWLPNRAPSGAIIIPDYKTADSASPGKFSRPLADYGYHMQAAWYTDAALALELAKVARFVFVVQEKTAPYLITIFQPDDRAIEIGRALNRRAIHLFAKCTAENRWPGYSDGVEMISLPYWYEKEFEATL